MKRFLLFIALICFSFVVFSQDNKEKAKEYANQALTKVKFELFKEGAKLFKKAIKLDPENMEYPYELCYTYYVWGNTKKAFKVIDPLIKAGKPIDDKHRFLYTLYTDMGKEYPLKPKVEEPKEPTSAEDYQTEALKLMGTDKVKARDYFDKAISLKPQNPDNYYYAAGLYAETEELIWTLIYSEIFVNLEPNTARTTEMKKLLYETWKKGITIKSKEEIIINLSKEKAVYNLDNFETKNFKVNFAQSFQTTLDLGAYRLADGFFITNMYFFYRDWVEYWFRGKELEFPCFLFDWQKSLFHAGHLEAYIFWLFKDSRPQEFTDWNKYSHKQLIKFEEWRDQNSMLINDNNKVNSFRY